MDLAPADLAARLADVPCWDAAVQAIYEARGEPLADVALQNRAELVAFAAFMRAHGVRSYLELGTWTGRSLCALQAALDLDRVAVCDHGYAQQLGLPLHLPPGCLHLKADSDSDAYRQWRAGLGPLDLVLIDANHHYRAVKRDFEINRAFDQRFIAFHDITGSNRHTRGVARLWQELEGWKQELVLPHAELGLAHSTMGIGIWAERAP